MKKWNSFLYIPIPGEAQAKEPKTRPLYDSLKNDATHLKLSSNWERAQGRKAG